MTAVDNAVREFNIALYPPSIPYIVFFCIALAVTIAAGAWLGMRFYLHRYGVETEGTITEESMKSYRIKGKEFSGSTRNFTHYLTIEFLGPDGERHTVTGRSYTGARDKDAERALRVGGKVPVFYSRGNPGNAVYYDPPWHYLVPGASLAAGLLLFVMAGSLCYKDIRAMNGLSLSGWTEEQYQGYQDVIIECDGRISGNPDDAASYERRGDARFAIVQFREAIADYSEALRLQPDRGELLLKRAKAEWLDGRDRAALRDWLKTR